MSIKKLEIKYISVLSLLLSAITYIILGLIFLTQKQIIIFGVKSFLNVLFILFLIQAFLQLIGISFNKKYTITSSSKVLGFILNMVAAYFIKYKSHLVVSILPLFFGIYALVSGLIRILIYIQYKRNKVKRRLYVVFEAVALLIIGLNIILEPLQAILPLTNLIGIFFILFGITNFNDALLEGVSKESKDKVKRRIRINLPVFMVALIPHKILNAINQALLTDDNETIDLNVNKTNQQFDLEVLIHVSKKGVGIFGHVDIFFEDRILTYGTYDLDTYKFGGLISDGVLIEIFDKEEYIKFAQKHSDKTLFGFGLKLNKSQKERVREKISEIFNNLYVWKPKSQLVSKYKVDKKDYASLVDTNLKANFYKFKQGEFKTYFALNTNCVLLADKIVGQAGIDIIKINGLITPGAYFDYFNKEFLRKNSFVISRNIYYNSNTQLKT